MSLLRGKAASHGKVQGLTAVSCANMARLVDLLFGLRSGLEWAEECTSQVQPYSPGGVNVPDNTLP